MARIAPKITSWGRSGREPVMSAGHGRAEERATCVVIDDHETLRVGVGSVLAMAGIHVVAEVDCVSCAMKMALEADLLVVDLQYGGEREACRALQGAEAIAAAAARWPHARILVYTSSSCERCAVAAAAAGSHGHVRKVEGNAALVEAAHVVMDGGTYVPAWLARLIERTEKDLGGPFKLTGRQLEVLQEVARGRTQQQVARKLNLTVDTVKEHMAALRSRMRAASTIEAVRLGAQAGLVGGFAPPSALACTCWAD